MSGVNLSNVGPSKKNPGARARQPPTVSRLSSTTLLGVALCIAACSPPRASVVPGPKPLDAPKEWKELLGIYSGEENKKASFILLEQDGKLFWRDEKASSKEFRIIKGAVVFPPSEGTNIVGHSVTRDEAGNVVGFCDLNFCFYREDPRAAPPRPHTL